MAWSGCEPIGRQEVGDLDELNIGSCLVDRPTSCWRSPESCKVDEDEIRDQRSVGWGGGCALSAQWGGGAALAMEGGGGWRGAAAVRPARDNKWVTAAPAGNRGGSHKHTRGVVGRGGWPWRGDGRQADERRVQVGRTSHATNITTIVHLNLQHQRNTGHSQLSRGVGEARGTARTIARTARSNRRCSRSAKWVEALQTHGEASAAQYSRREPAEVEMAAAIRHVTVEIRFF